MIKTVSAIAIIVATVFTGCVGTVVADNDAKMTQNRLTQKIC